MAKLAALLVALAVGVGTAQQPRPPGQGPAPTGAGMLAGRVVDADSGQGIAGATVTVSLARPGGAAVGLVQSRYPSVLTDSQGRYVFSMLPAGTFIGNANREGYTSTILQRSIDVSAGAQITDFNFRLFRYNTIVGTVRDEAGDPVVGTDVVAFARVSAQGRPAALAQRNRSRTDDRGEYRLVDLAAGQYFICACSRDPIPFDGQLLTTLAARPLDLLSIARRATVAGSETASLDSTLRTYAPTFYPNATLASRAERVQVARGETRTGVDITVSTVRAVRVSGQIIGLPPNSISAGAVRLTAVGDLPEAKAIAQLQPMLVQPDGRFDFASVPPGTYLLDVNAVAGIGSAGPTGSALAFVGSRGGAPPPPPPPPAPGGRGTTVNAQDVLWATETIVVGDADVTGLVVPIQRGVTLRGRLEFVGSAPPPQTPRAIIQLTGMEARPMRPSIYLAQHNPDGTFQFALPPGRYVFQSLPTFAGPWGNTRSITLKGQEVRDVPITIESDNPEMVITVTDTPQTSFQGTVDLPADEVPEEWAVLIFPSDRRLWKEPFGTVRRFVAARVTGIRDFGTRIPPGDYHLVMSRGVPPDWIEESALEELAKGATTVSVNEGETRQVQVRR